MADNKRDTISICSLYDRSKEAMTAILTLIITCIAIGYIIYAGYLIAGILSGVDDFIHKNNKIDD